MKVKAIDELAHYQQYLLSKLDTSHATGKLSSNRYEAYHALISTDLRYVLELQKVIEGNSGAADLKYLERAHNHIAERMGEILRKQELKLTTPGVKNDKQ